MIINHDPEFVITLQRVIEFIGTFAFALSGIRLAASKHYDWLGGFVCGIAVAIGGGTIRDVMLGVRPFWMLSPIYMICTLFAQCVVIVCHHYLRRLDTTWFLFDTLGLALFNIAGIQKNIGMWLPILGCYHYGMHYGSCRRSDQRCAAQRRTCDLQKGNIRYGLCGGRTHILVAELVAG